MNEIDYFKKIILYSGDVAATVNKLYFKKIYFVSLSYIVIENSIYFILFN
jgi:hypothetical protein